MTVRSRGLEFQTFRSEVLDLSIRNGDHGGSFPDSGEPVLDVLDRSVPSGRSIDPGSSEFHELPAVIVGRSDMNSDAERGVGSGLSGLERWSV